MTGKRMGALVALAVAMTANVAAGQEISKAQDGQMGFMAPATPVMERIESFHNELLVIITAICVLVALLLLWVMLRYNRRANPQPSKTSHNTVLEIVWTAVPIGILVLIAVPSFKLLYLEDTTPPADLVIKVTGHQWYWSYEYPDADNLAFDAIMLPAKYFDDPSPATQAERKQAEAQLAAFLGRSTPPETYRLLDTDTRVVVPVNKVVKLLVTASDVIHSWAMPAFGIKIDAIPGRLNETWFKATKVGTYYGQCSEICGIGHSFMPIVVEVVSEDDFNAWLAKTRADYAAADGTPVRMAALAHD